MPRVDSKIWETGSADLRLFRGAGGGVRVELNTGGATPTILTSNELTEA